VVKPTDPVIVGCRFLTSPHTYDNEKVGKLQANDIARQAGTNDKANPKSVVMIKGRRGQQTPPRQEGVPIGARYERLQRWRTDV